MSGGVECIQAHETLDRAAQLMRELGVGALPICSDDRVTGIITDRDIVVKCVAAGHDPARTRAGDMATGLVWVPADADNGALEQYRQQVEDNLNAATVRAYAIADNRSGDAGRG